MEDSVYQNEKPLTLLTFTGLVRDNHGSQQSSHDNAVFSQDSPADITLGANCPPSSPLTDSSLPTTPSGDCGPPIKQSMLLCPWYLTCGSRAIQTTLTPAACWYNPPWITYRAGAFSLGIHMHIPKGQQTTT